MGDEIHWDFDRDFTRDDDREPARHATRRLHPQLNARGTLRIAHEAAQAAKPLCQAGATSADGSSLHLCKLPAGHVGAHVFPNVGLSGRTWGGK